MSDNPAPGVYRIISLNQGASAPVGVNFTLPTFQNVYLNAPVQHWVLRIADDGTYRLSAGGYPFTGVYRNNVVASINAGQDVGWQLTYSEFQNAYTIARADNSELGWTVQRNLSDGANVSLKPIISLPSNPPQFIPTQLFEFQRIDRDD